MHDKYYSKAEFDALRERLNAEISRRGTYKWWTPLMAPTVGTDRSSDITDKSYTINNPSTGAIEPTRNINNPAQGNNPVQDVSNSSVRFDADEARNFLIGLSKIHDIDLFYGRDENPGLAFRVPEDVDTKLTAAEKDIIRNPRTESVRRYDPNGGVTNQQRLGYGKYPAGDTGVYVDSPAAYPTGEYDGEEILPGHNGPDETNFYDDYGAQPNDINHHPQNPYVSSVVERINIDQDERRNESTTVHTHGGKDSVRFGLNPRNPNKGSEYNTPRQTFDGEPGLCHVSCTGLCWYTCDSECSESCMSTCWNRCGNACYSECRNVCTGCSTLCYTTCRTRCTGNNGVSCFNVGAETVTITTNGNASGCSLNCGAQTSSLNLANNITYTTHTCTGCSYTCQFWPNKKTSCWDSVCSTLCFTTCSVYCSSSCFGGCINNSNEHSGGYKSGKGQSCKEGCVADCTGACAGVCEGICSATCFEECKSSCTDNCSGACDTNCGSCDTGCSSACYGCNGCTGNCMGTCSGTCKGSCETSCSGSCETSCSGSCDTTSTAPTTGP